MYTHKRDYNCTFIFKIFGQSFMIKKKGKIGQRNFLPEKEKNHLPICFHKNLIELCDTLPSKLYFVILTAILFLFDV